MQMGIRIRRIAVCAAVLFCSVSVFGDSEEPVAHRFSMWGVLEDKKLEKLHFYWGFTNGLLVGAGAPMRSDDTPGKKLLDCLLQPYHPGADQAIAMIDKYYRDNPAKWDTPIGKAIIEALMVKDGPCSTNRSQ